MWNYVDNTAVMEISIKNTLVQESSHDRIFLAVLDTGYSGFLYIPERLFRKLGFDKLRTKKLKATLADGGSFGLSGAYGSISFPSLENLTVDGIVETSKGAREILIGMEGIRSLALELNCCRQTLNVASCV